MSPIPDASLTGNENARQQIAAIAAATGSTIQDVERSTAALAEALAGERSEVTPAIQRAAKALAEHVGGPTQELEAEGVPEMTVRRAEAHVALAAALDVEEMAAVMADHPDIWPSPSGWKCAGCGRLVPGRVRSELREAAKQKHQARALRAAILGGAS